jgi:hypothetical protein
MGEETNLTCSLCGLPGSPVEQIAKSTVYVCSSCLREKLTSLISDDIEYCESCRRLQTSTSGPFDYTPLTALDPRFYRITLENIALYCCGCGDVPEIPDAENLHAAISQELLNETVPLYHGTLRFVRKMLGLSREEFDERLRALGLPSQALLGVSKECNYRILLCFFYEFEGDPHWVIREVGLEPLEAI